MQLVAVDRVASKEEEEAAVTEQEVATPILWKSPSPQSSMSEFISASENRSNVSLGLLGFHSSIQLFVTTDSFFRCPYLLVAGTFTLVTPLYRYTTVTITPITYT